METVKNGEQCMMKAYAKINIALNVLNRRKDGYHNLQTIMHTIALYDIVGVEKSVGRSINLKTNRDDLPIDNRNIAYRAAELFMSSLGISGGLNIEIEKSIPVAAGLAGGSTDAAAVLKALNSIFKCNLSLQQLMDMGLTLGADVPFCIMGGTALAEGIGEILTPINDIGRETVFVVAKPPLEISTKYVYQNLDLSNTREFDIQTIVTLINGQQIKTLAQNMYNILETVTAQQNPVIDRIKSTMLQHGAWGALMSGSGPSVFGIFPNKQSARNASNDLKNKFKEVFIC